MATGGNHDWASRIASEVEDLVSQFTGLDGRKLVIRRLAYIAAASGDYDRAEALVLQITDPSWQAELFGWLAKVAAEGSDHDQAARLIINAEALTARLTDPYQRAMALSYLAAAVLAADEDKALGLADEAEALAAQLADPCMQTLVFDALADLAVAGRDYDRAEILVTQIVEPRSRMLALSQLAEAMDGDGDHHRAARLVIEVEVLANGIPNQYERAEVLSNLALTLHRMNPKTLSIRENTHTGLAALVHPRSLLAEALAIGSWDKIIFNLALVEQAIVAALVDALELRWKL